MNSYKTCNISIRHSTFQTDDVMMTCHGGWHNTEHYTIQHWTLHYTILHNTAKHNTSRVRSQCNACADWWLYDASFIVSRINRPEQALRLAGGIWNTCPKKPSLISITNLVKHVCCLSQCRERMEALSSCVCVVWRVCTFVRMWQCNNDGSWDYD